VQVVGRADDDGVNPRTGEQLAGILRDYGLAPRACLRPRGPSGVGVAQRHDLHAGNLL
jgi:hypothetical protein